MNNINPIYIDENAKTAFGSLLLSLGLISGGGYGLGQVAKNVAVPSTAAKVVNISVKKINPKLFARLSPNRQLSQLLSLKRSGQSIDEVLNSMSSQQLRALSGYMNPYSMGNGEISGLLSAVNNVIKLKG